MTDSQVQTVNSATSNPYLDGSFLSHPFLSDRAPATVGGRPTPQPQSQPQSRPQSRPQTTAPGRSRPPAYPQGLSAAAGAKYAPQNRSTAVTESPPTQIPLADAALSSASPGAASLGPDTLDWENPPDSRTSSWQKQRQIAEARIAALQVQHHQILAAERRRLQLELSVFFLAILGILGVIWRWNPELLSRLDGFQLIPLSPTHPNPGHLGVGENPRRLLGPHPLADTAAEDSQQGVSASDPASPDRSTAPSNTAADSPSSDPSSAQTPLLGHSTSADPTIESFPDDIESPLNLMARSSQRPIEGLAASLPANLAKPVDRNWRIGGYRVSDIYLPCQQPDGSDCRSNHPVTGAQDVAHWGVDLAMPYGAPLYAVGKEGSEVKVSCYYDGAKGLVAQLSSSSFPTYEFEAFHLSDCLPGIHRAGSLFAAVGNSGISNGPHLHWEAFWYGQRVNPPRWSLEFVVTGKIQVSRSNKYIY
ncbi:MAG: M23 family metallopeptidase [Phormidium sp. BM_Day4_Bin.17]|nr:M23 family metallopeptidase [Phormidium sp. BM_Day4_Bin.17]UCJ13899.1 MAG: hypothetical protein JWS08_09315 [Phormidium sp. PBR-2020]